MILSSNFVRVVYQAYPLPTLPQILSRKNESGDSLRHVTKYMTMNEEIWINITDFSSTKRIINLLYIISFIYIIKRSSLMTPLLLIWYRPWATLTFSQNTK